MLDSVPAHTLPIPRAQHPPAATATHACHANCSIAVQLRTLTNVRTVNIPTKPMLNSSLKIVSAKHVSMIALLSFSFTLSSSISRNVPKKICRTEGMQECRSSGAPVAGGDVALFGCCFKLQFAARIAWLLPQQQ